MKKVTVPKNETNYNCPHCGEGYINLSPRKGVTITVCDGQDGCGKQFQVEVK